MESFLFVSLKMQKIPVIKVIWIVSLAFDIYNYSCFLVIRGIFSVFDGKRFIDIRFNIFIYINNFFITKNEQNLMSTTSWWQLGFFLMYWSDLKTVYQKKKKKFWRLTCRTTPRTELSCNSDVTVTRVQWMVEIIYIYYPLRTRG